MADITLCFQDITVLDQVNFELYPGEICAIMGENASGKSSLMKVLAGIYPATSGTITVSGKQVFNPAVFNMQQSGIYMIQQKPNLIDFFTVEQNVFIGKERQYGKTNLIKKKEQAVEAQEVLEALQSDIPISAIVSTLSPIQKIIVEIVKAMVRSVKVLIIDEPLPMLTSPESQTLFRILLHLASSGMAVVYISHNLDDVIKISNRIIIMREGKIIDEIFSKNFKSRSGYNKVLSKITGPEYLNRYPKTLCAKKNIIMRFDRLASSDGNVKHASMYIREGEIVGIAGIQEAGKTTLTRLLSGSEKCRLGTIYFNDKRLSRKDACDFFRDGIVFFSSQLDENLIMDMDIQMNVTLPSLLNFIRGLFIDQKKCYYHTKSVIERIGIKNAEPENIVNTLSTGTRLKVVIAKLLETHPRVLILDEPSANLDSASKVELFNIMNKIAHKGGAIFFTSSDIPELLGMSDRIYVMYNGGIIAELNAKETNSIDILKHATGKW
jgi:ABC-type sugar transport system ATPase subunit